MNGQRLIYSDREFARLGTGQVAYIKKINTDELARCFPELPPMTPGVEIWGLFGAAGEPIVLSDVRAQALAGAHEHELLTVTLQ